STGEDAPGDRVFGLRRDGGEQRDSGDRGQRPTSGRRERGPGSRAGAGGDAVLRGGGRPGGRYGSDRRGGRDVSGDRHPAPSSRPARLFWGTEKRRRARGGPGARGGRRRPPGGDYAQPQRAASAASRAEGRAGRAGPPGGQPRGPRPPAVRFQPLTPGNARGGTRDRPPRERLGARQSAGDDRDYGRRGGQGFGRDGALRREVRGPRTRGDDGAEQGALRRDSRRGDRPDRHLPDDAGFER